MLLIIIECAVFFPVSLLTVKNKGCQWQWKIVRCFILLILFTFPHLSAQFRHQRNDSGRYLRQSMRINAPSMALSRNFFSMGERATVRGLSLFASLSLLHTFLEVGSHPLLLEVGPLIQLLGGKRLF